MGHALMVLLPSQEGNLSIYVIYHRNSYLYYERNQIINIIRSVILAKIKELPLPSSSQKLMRQCLVSSKLNLSSYLLLYSGFL